MRRMLPPAAAVLLALSACGAEDSGGLREDLAEITAAPEAPEVAEDQEGLFEPVTATTELVDPEGSAVGGARLTDGERGVTLAVEVAGFTPGYHGLGLYEIGDCAPGGADEAIGDLLLELPPVLVLENGIGSSSALIDTSSVVEELLVDDGTAVVVGPSADLADAGAPSAGSRAACGAFGEDTPAMPAEPFPEEDPGEFVGEEDPDAVDPGTGGLDNDEDTDAAVEDGEG